MSVLSLLRRWVLRHFGSEDPSSFLEDEEDDSSFSSTFECFSPSEVRAAFSTRQRKEGEEVTRAAAAAAATYHEDDTRQIFQTKKMPISNLLKIDVRKIRFSFQVQAGEDPGPHPAV